MWPDTDDAINCQFLVSTDYRCSEFRTITFNYSCDAIYRDTWPTGIFVEWKLTRMYFSPIKQLMKDETNRCLLVSSESG